MGNGIATWRSRIGLFTPCQIHHIRQLHGHTKPGTNPGTTTLFFFNYYNEKLSSLARSLDVLLYNRRLRKNISTRLNQADHTHHPTSSTPQLNTPHEYGTLITATGNLQLAL